jgi:predicted Zn-dependent protease
MMLSEAPISTKRRSPRSGNSWLKSLARVTFLSVLPPLITGAQALAATIPAPTEVTVVREALDQVARMEYAAAENQLITEIPASSPARPYFAGLAAMNRFLDLGDTNALRRAERYWEALSPRGDPSPLFKKTDARTLTLYRGLAGMQLSYSASLRGERLLSTRIALAARSKLEEAQTLPEARLALMLFDYYRGRLLQKIPFVTEASFDAQVFENRTIEVPLLRDMFLGSLFWIHVDNGRYAAAEAITADFLRRYPGNRLARQMRGAVLYRAGRYEEARELQETLKTEFAAAYAGYPKSAGLLPLGYYRAVGNLARVSKAEQAKGMGRGRDLTTLMAEWRKAEKAGLMPWLPPVLKRDLSDE